MFFEVLQNPNIASQHTAFAKELKDSENFRLNAPETLAPVIMQPVSQTAQLNNDIHDHVEVEESLNIMDKEKELIVKALKKHKGKRKDAAMDLGISERTLYRKLKEYDIEE